MNFAIRAEYYNSCPMKSAVQIAANMESQVKFKE